MVLHQIVGSILIAVAIVSGPASAKPVVEPNPRDVDLGQFKVGQKKECRVSIRNAGDGDLEIERVTTSCACVSAEIDSQVIPPGRSVSLKIAAERPYPGPFSYSAIVIPKGRDGIEPLKITVRGEAVSSVSAQAGWQGGLLQNVVGPDPIDLGTKHQSSADLIVNITSLDGSSLRESVLDANGLHFCLDEVIPRFLPAVHSEPVENISCPGLTVLLRPRKPLEPGRLQDTLELSMTDGSKVHIPIVCRIVGDVYLDREVIHLGRLAQSSECKLHVLSVDKTKRWQVARWEGAGLLYDAIAIRDGGDEQTGEMALVLTIDQVKRSRLPRGYLFCKMRLYECPQDPGLTVFLDGHN